MNKKHNNINYKCNINQTGKGVGDIWIVTYWTKDLSFHLSDCVASNYLSNVSYINIDSTQVFTD